MVLMQKLDNDGNVIEGATKMFSYNQYVALMRQKNVKWRKVEDTPPKLSREMPKPVKDVVYAELTKGTDKKRYIAACEDIDQLNQIAETETVTWVAVAARNRIKELSK